MLTTAVTTDMMMDEAMDNTDDIASGSKRPAKQAIKSLKKRGRFWTSRSSLFSVEKVVDFTGGGFARFGVA